ncbi:LacI family DNA-binding transcriptional regulator [Cellulomonas alba]|uniref:LacI family DNA-binding transcriptional regulator n=1 Tax=Cellulomonas alba TaxID=3053467 RepID=A0ABT7SCL0_9CELL|nr:LacI family DNA-binding transcriptional regulator [Cellulomonas alba]MDM7853926.1 LacI family DNA-binding transcriptional regulator [Cellulomonas alba]
MPVTMRDVAERAGVSIKTVSNVLNGYSYLRPATRERVEVAIAELGYRINMSARHLRKGRTGMIGLALPELAHPYFAEFADLMIVEAEKVGFRVLIERTGATRDGALTSLDSSQRRITDGLMFFPLGLDPDDGELLAVDYPLVLLGERIFGAPVDHVTMANVEAARAATVHLAEQGCRRIVALGARLDEGMGSPTLRLEGYREGLASAGLAFDPALVVEVDPWTRQTGADGIARLLDSGVDFDGVFAMNDSMAFGVLHELHTRKIAVPEDVAVIGFDDVDDAGFHEPPLSSIAPGRVQIAREAVRMLVERIDGDTQPPRLAIADFELRARESSRRPQPALSKVDAAG